MPHLEKLLEYCALAPNIEKYCEREIKFEEKHPIVAEVVLPLVPVIGGLVIAVGVLFWFGSIEFHTLCGLLMGSLLLNLGGLLTWSALKKRTTRKKLGYSFGFEAYPRKGQTHAILEKLLRLPSTPQTQDLKKQLWSLADKNVLPWCWWNDVEKEINAWMASYERDALKAKLLEPTVLETIAVEVEPATHLAEPSHQHVVL